MNLPKPEDYIDIHVHSGTPAPGIFIIEALMAHETKKPENLPGVSYTYGIHPWFLTETNKDQQMVSVQKTVMHPLIIAVGEAGFDKLRGPSPEIQRNVFERQVRISEINMKPLIIHCVRSWDELLAGHKKLKPSMPWMIHGFRGKLKLAQQLISKGLYLSVWFEFALRPESSELLRNIPRDRIFLETDGADVDIRDIYKKVSEDMKITVGELKTIIYSNFNEFFGLKKINNP